MKITIESIPHDQHRYETVGDWEIKADGFEIRVSKMPDERMEFAVAVHELIEVYLCKLRGISEESVNEFDMKFEASRPEGNEDEPGDEPDAPYRKEHFFATSIERLLCAEMGLDWKTYDEAVYAL